ncbi:Multicopper oxidase [compost metagenome]
MEGKPYTLYVRTRYERYIGEFVLHCHILDHEDQGMMQNVSIELSNGQGGTAPAHH